MISELRKNEKGFTIIEVVLVLAIAGLIFLIVFLALPQLQRSRRDTQRRGDAGKLIGSLESYASNSNGLYPTGAEQANFVTTYVTGKLTAPEGTAYNVTWSTSGTALSAINDVRIGVGAICLGNSFTTTGATPRSAGVMMKLEEGQFCQDNQ